MKYYTKQYINGEFVESHGREEFDLINPSTGELAGKVTLGDEVDVERAVKAAKEAFKTFSKTTIDERAELLDRLSSAYASRKEEHMKALVEEYGGTQMMSQFSTERAINVFKVIKDAMYSGI